MKKPVEIHWDDRLEPVTSAGRAGNKPYGMTKLKMEPELADGLTRVAIGIFTDMSRAGKPFPDILLSILLSGMHFAVEIMQDEAKAKAKLKSGEGSGEGSGLAYEPSGY